MAWTNILGQTRVGIRGAQAQVQTTSLLLDSYSGAAAAYSLRKLTSTYTGNAIRVRRSSDNTEQNIGFDAGGNLNTIALLAFVGSGSGFVTTWYDQSGNGYNFTQTTAANQPQIVSTGSITTKNSKPTIKFDGINDYMTILNSQSTFSFLHKIGQSFVSFVGYGVSSTEYVLLENNWGSTAHIGYSLWTTANNNITNFITKGISGSPVSSNTNASNTIVPNTLFMVNTEADPGNATASLRSKLYFNNSSVVTNNVYTNTTSTSNATYNLNLGAAVGVSPYSFLNGGFSELIIYNSDQSTNRSSIASNINTYYSIYASDTDAQAFITAAGITDGTQLSAVNTLVVDLKAAGVWSKMKALYPFVGGSATSHKFNLKDPRDLDAAYRLTFVGGWTHSSAGAQSNGTTGYANPNINANQIFTSTDGLMGVYTPSTSLINSSYIYGVSNMADSEWGMYYGSGSLSFGMYRSNSVSSTTTLPGLSAIGMETNGHRSVYKNNSRLISSAAGFISMPQNLKMYLSARNANGNTDGFASGLYSFSFISSTLTLTEYSAFYTAVQKYQTTLGRQVGTPVGTSNMITTGLILNLDASNPTSYSGTGTTWTDLTGANNGTLVNAPTYDSTNGGSILFDGVNDYVNITNKAPINDTDFTYDFWFRTNNNNNVYQTLITQIDGDYLNSAALHKARSGWSGAPGSIYFQVQGNTLVSTLNGAGLVAAGIINYTAVAKKESGYYKLYLYRNGVLDNSMNTSITTINMSTWSNLNTNIGRNSAANGSYGDYLNGNIYSGKVYNRALSATEVLQNFNATKSRFGL